MKYLLDVNALVALSHSQHSLHPRSKSWFKTVNDPAARFLTCAITELGFVRVSVQTGLQVDVQAARKALAALKATKAIPFEIVSDGIGAEDLPAFVRTPSKLTDGHLLVLARHHGAQLATLDTGIPGSLLLPQS
jgi:predicted nucleic acid-binding protein